MVDAMASISQNRANMIKPSLTQQSTIILKGSAALVLVLIDVNLWQGCFLWIQPVEKVYQFGFT